jgi:hypothetical protein
MKLTYAAIVSCVLCVAAACGDDTDKSAASDATSLGAAPLARPQLSRPPVSGLPDELRPPR